MTKKDLFLFLEEFTPFAIILSASMSSPESVSSSIEKLGTPLRAAFIPLVPEASLGLSGVFNQTSTPDVISFPNHIL